MIMKGFVQWNRFYSCEDLARVPVKLGTATLVGQCLTQGDTGAPGLAKAILQGTVKGKRRRGRYRKRW